MHVRPRTVIPSHHHPPIPRAGARFARPFRGTDHVRIGAPGSRDPSRRDDAVHVRPRRSFRPITILRSREQALDSRGRFGGPIMFESELQARGTRRAGRRRARAATTVIPSHHHPPIPRAGARFARPFRGPIMFESELGNVANPEPAGQPGSKIPRGTVQRLQSLFLVFARRQLDVNARAGEIPRHLHVRDGHRRETRITGLPLQQSGKIAADLASEPGSPVELSGHQTVRSNSNRRNTSIRSPT